MHLLSWNVYLQLAFPAYAVAVASFIGGWRFREAGQPMRWQNALLFIVSAAAWIAAFVLTGLALYAGGVPAMLPGWLHGIPKEVIGPLLAVLGALVCFAPIVWVYRAYERRRKRKPAEVSAQLSGSIVPSSAPSSVVAGDDRAGSQQPPRPIAAPPKALPSAYSLAYTEFERDGDHVYLKVTNRGTASAVFWALIDPSGPMADIPDGSCARWVHSDDAKISIPNGEARKLRIARYSGPLYGFGAWRIPYAFNDAIQSVTPLRGVLAEWIDVTVTVRADPELRGGAIIRRLRLDNSGHWAIKT